MKTAIRDPAELCRRLELDASWIEPARRAAELFPLFAPRDFVDRMKPGDPRDPLLLQVLPLGAELESSPGFSNDPVGDRAALAAPGLLQKYSGRALLITTGACAVHCRYCFRRHYPYHETPKSLTAWEPALAAIAADTSLHEVILSGGDPLTLNDSVLADLSRRLGAVPHLRRLRVHTRLPLMIPARVTESLRAWLTGSRLAPILVLHANHAAELSGEAAGAVSRLADAGVMLLNQSVLLRGINDDAETLVELSERLIDLRVIPYYLHQLDRVQGARHFEVDVERGKSLMRELRARLPGYAVPRYVIELPGEISKRPLA